VFDRLTLLEDLVDCRGEVLAPRGTVVSPEAIEEAADGAPRLARRRLAETSLADDVSRPFELDTYRALFSRPGAREAVERTLLAVELPGPLLDELAAMRQALPGVYLHGLLTAAVSVRVLAAAAGSRRTLVELAAAALLHDLGMRQVPAHLVVRRERLTTEQAHRLAGHPLLGAFHLARLLGHHPAVAAARCHHWRCGQGYPGLAAPPPRAIEALSVASAFCALTQPRPYRSGAFDARGAVDVLVKESLAGHADGTTVKLLVHTLRGGAGDPRGLRFATSRDGHAPLLNGHSPVEAPARSQI
jgi:hypothetical protein